LKGLMMAMTIFMQGAPGSYNTQFSSGIQKRIAAVQHGAWKSSDV
jgi:hypothetical protein